MNTYAKVSSPAPALVARTPDSPFLADVHAVTNPAPLLRSPRSECSVVKRTAFSASSPRTTEAPLIYAVDDLPDLTELYTTLLEATGYIVRAFNDRAEALAALEADKIKPDLLITDYLGPSMPVDRFVRRCLDVHPTLRILMASGFNQTNVRVTGVEPDRLIHKPFTPEELREEVRAALGP